MKAIQNSVLEAESYELLGTLHCKCHYPVPVSVSYDILPDFSKVSGHLYDSSDDLVDAGSAPLMAKLKHDGGLILTTKHGAWHIEPTCIIGSGQYMVEFNSICRVNLEISFKPVTEVPLEAIDIKTVEDAEFQAELRSKDVKLERV